MTTDGDASGFRRRARRTPINQANCEEKFACTPLAKVAAFAGPEDWTEGSAVSVAVAVNTIRVP